MMNSVFVLACVAAVACWFIGVAEWLLAWRFVPFVYRIGIPVLQETLHLPLPAHPVGVTSKTTTSKFTLLDSQTCLFRPMHHLTGLSIQTPFPIKGVIAWEPNGARVVGRIPVGPTGFLLAWLVGWTAGGLGVSATNLRLGLPFTLLGWAFGAAMIGFSLWYELRRARRILSELSEALAQASA